ncbi:hypothetical protein NKH73_20630 [Mesorhizobium sp. M0938]|uniref:hypothetical protein n=1 Tax=unclassified Mesorhizobium TaxID=325217 RepID=UPI00333B50FB
MKRYRLSLAIAQRFGAGALRERHSIRGKVVGRRQELAGGTEFGRIRAFQQHFCSAICLVAAQWRRIGCGFVRGSKKSRTAPNQGLHAQRNCRIENL